MQEYTQEQLAFIEPIIEISEKTKLHNDYTYKNNQHREIEKILSLMNFYSNNNSIFLVEGKKDVSSLRKLNIEANFVTVSSKPLIEITEEIASMNQKIIILTDWDNQGEFLAHRLAEYLQNMGVDYDTCIRNQLKNILKKDIKDIEGLYKHVSKLRNTCA